MPPAESQYGASSIQCIISETACMAVSGFECTCTFDGVLIRSPGEQARRPHATGRVSHRSRASPSSTPHAAQTRLYATEEFYGMQDSQRDAALS